MTVWSDDETREYVREVLKGAADDISEYGWRTGGAGPEEIDPFGDYPRCIWIALVRAAEADSLLHTEAGFDYNKSTVIYEGEELLKLVTGVDSISDLFDLNDSKSPEEGKQWAVGTLEKAADLAIVPVQSESPKDSLSTEKTESGNTHVAESRVKSLLRKLRLVK